MRIVLFFGFFLFALTSFSQNNCKYAEKKLKKVEKFILHGETDKALSLLLKIEDICQDPFFQTAVGDIYFSCKDISKAYRFYFNSYMLNGLKNIQSNSTYNFVQSAYKTGNYTVFNNIVNNDAIILKMNSDPDFIKLVQKNTFALNAKKDSVLFNPVSLNINSSQDEYFPSMPINSDIIIYTYRNKDLEFQDEDFYISRKKDGFWEEAVRVGNNINSEYREGSLSVTIDGKDVFFASCHRPDSYGGCDLYYSSLIDDTLWSESYNLGPIINTKYWESQPSISADGNLLFFTSNRDGGYGGSDIWMSKKNNNTWIEPINLGPSINTSSDESTPFLHYDNKTFYFSSKGHDGFGGFDLYVTELNHTGTFNKVSNLGYPINTHFDESGLIVKRDGLTGYYNSNSDDDLNIYSFTLPQEKKANPVAIINGLVIDSINRRGVKSNIIINEIANSVEHNVSSNHNGVFACAIPLELRFSITVLAEGYDFFSSNYRLTPNEYSKDINIVLNRLNVGNKISLDNIYYEFDDYSLTSESMVEIEKFAQYLISNNHLKVEIEGHTDNIGSDSYNIVLSKKRAKSVYDALLKLGVSFKQLSYKGYGYSIPLVNEDSDDARLKNRRTEIKVLGTYE